MNRMTTIVNPIILTNNCAKVRWRRNAVGLFLWCFMCMGLNHAQTLAANIRQTSPPFQEKLIPLKSILDQYEQTLGISFLYDPTLIEGQFLTDTPQATKGDWELELNKRLHRLGIHCKRIGDNAYVLKKWASTSSSNSRKQGEVKHMDERIDNKLRLPDLKSLEIQLQPQQLSRSSLVKVSGTVRDEQGNPVIGATVVYKGANIGTFTDDQGRFTLEVPSKDVSLFISYIGFETQEVPLQGRTEVDIVLVAKPTYLDEVIVVGYGEVQKRDLIGSVDKIDSKKIQNLPVTSVDLALAGQSAGVQFRQGSGQPGAGAEILIRGVGSVSAGNQPLIVIDGLPFGNYNGQTNNLLALLDPNDIESVSVIRDASGKAIYGSRAANGLILITTKRGKTGKPTIEFNSYIGLQTIPDFEKPDVLNATELAQFLRERIEDQAIVNGTTPNIPEHLENPQIYGEGTDWFDAITQNAMMENINLKVRGGSDNMKYSLGLGYMNQDGTIIETNLKRYSLRANIDADITKWLHFGMELSPSWTSNASGNTDPGGGQFSVYNVVNVSQWADPTAPLYDENGDLTTTTQGALLPFFQANPVYKLRNQTNQRDNRQVLLGANLKVDLIKGLYFKTYFGTNYLNNASRSFSPGSVVGTGLTPNNPDPQANSRSSAGRYESIRLVSTNTLNFDRKFSEGKHKINAVLGYSAEYQKETSMSVGGSRLIDENFPLFNSGNIATSLPTSPDETRIFFSGSEGISEQALLSYFGRVRYTFANRYILTGTVRTDGSSRFGPNNKFATFPSVGLAWRVTEEPWFPESGFLSDLRLEGSWGLSGNNRIGNYAWQGIVRTNADYVIGGGRAEGAFLADIPSPSLKWEETEQLDIGIDLGLWGGRVNLGVDVFDQQTEKLLFNVPLPRITGFGSYLTNLGLIQNRGLEISLNTQAILTPKTAWTIDANVSFNRNEVLKLGAEDLPIRGSFAGNGTPVSWTIVGEPVGQYYGLEILGLYTEELLEDPTTPRYPGAVPGSPYYTDGDGDGKLESLEDYVFIGNPWPNFTFGLTNMLSWHDFELRVIAAGEVGSKILDLQREFMLNTDGVFNVRSVVKDRWRPGDTDFSLRPPTTTSVPSSQRFRWPNTLGVLDGTYLKINNVTLTYNFGQRVNFVQSGRIYVSVQNALVFAKFRGNPEIRRAAVGPLERNINYGSYPISRTFTLGLTISL